MDSMEQYVVKNEIQPSEEILLFYVDEDGGNEQGVLTTVENIEQIHEQQVNRYDTYNIVDTGLLIEKEGNSEFQNDISMTKERWTDSETKRLLIFYIDNKENFITGATKKKHLWTVACKTMLSGKNPNSCEMKLRYMKKKYYHARIEQGRGNTIKWAYYTLCHQAFHDDSYVNSLLRENAHQSTVQDTPNTEVYLTPDVPTTKAHSTAVTYTIDKMEIMLNLYIKHKNSTIKECLQKEFWDAIARELGEEDGEYWHKRFLNYKQHYLRMYEKRQENGPNSVNWAYMNLFDQIFEKDEAFQMKYNKTEVVPKIEKNTEIPTYVDWDHTEMTVLVKYYFDSFSEFQDPTIPNNFLWNEVGRLLDKSPESCKKKFFELRSAHFNKYFEGGYDIRNRIPLSILFDNIISRETQQELLTTKRQTIRTLQTEEIDVLVQFFYDNIEMFKDSVCHYVCFACIAMKLDKNLISIKKQWDELKRLYQSILDDKKEDAELQIDWRYIELFDRIFDYGMDVHLLAGYEITFPENEKGPIKIMAKKVDIKLEDNKNSVETLSENEDDDEQGYGPGRRKRTGDSKAFRILEYYLKNKDKFTSSNLKKQSLWEVLGKQIGLSGTQCAHRFRNFKQVYTSYVQREIRKPEMPIVWPYYALCKKVFGYRAIKSKLKNGKLDTDEEEDWSHKEIKQLIEYFAKNFSDMTNLQDNSKWTLLAQEIGKTEASCNDKFLELRKSYRKLKTMKERNADVKVSWKYYIMIDNIYKANEGVTENILYEQLQVDGLGDQIQADEDYQCIIVLPEGQDINDFSNNEVINENEQQEINAMEVLDTPNPTIEVTPLELNPQTEVKKRKWTKRSKKRLLILYLNYLRRNRNKEIISTEMWEHISSKFINKTPLSCRKMFAKLKSSHKIPNDDPNKTKTPYFALMEKIFAAKPKFSKITKKALSENIDFKDVPLPTDKVEQALKWYLRHIEEFVDPQIDNKYLWIELANDIGEPVTKAFNKVNYLKQHYIPETQEVSTEKSQFSELLAEIISKEIELKNEVDTVKPQEIYESLDKNWLDDEIEELLTWYLKNLEKFKNPKYIRSYLWMEPSNLLRKSPLECSKKMAEVRTQYRTMVKENQIELNVWRFSELCQKIYGTGKKSNQESSMMEIIA